MTIHRGAAAAGGSRDHKQPRDTPFVCVAFVPTLLLPENDLGEESRGIGGICAASSSSLLCVCGLALVCVCVCVCVVERERESGGTRERERDWLADRRRWRETTTTSIQEGLAAAASKQSAWTRRARAAAHAGCVCVTRDGKTIITGRGCKHAGRACRRPRESGCVLDVERVYGGGERSRAETERVHTERIAGSTAGCVVDRFV